jgi:hypothetical protein
LEQVVDAFYLDPVQFTAAAWSPVGTAVASAILILLLVPILSCVSPSGPAVLIDTSSGTARFRVEIADTDVLRERGLMGRSALDDDAGMVFIWAADTSGPFWMKDTLVPLTVAFISEGGEILRTLDMEPCRTDPCTIYDPRVTYRMALEVKQGELERRGVRAGDRARLVR